MDVALLVPVCGQMWKVPSEHFIKGIEANLYIFPLLISIVVNLNMSFDIQ